MGVVSSATSHLIYEDAERAYYDLKHPCHDFRGLQPGVSDAEWQLPEPFNGNTASAGIVFLGLNPSFNPTEKVPRIGATFELWDHFYRHRFDSDASQWAKLYRQYQQVGQTAVGDEFLLGRDALVTEIVRFRSAKQEGVTLAVLEHELPITRRLLEEVAPLVIVSVGKKALSQLRLLFPQLERELPDNFQMGAVEGRVFSVSWGDLRTEVRIVPSSHLTGARGLTKEGIAERIGKIGRLVGKALR